MRFRQVIGFLLPAGLFFLQNSRNAFFSVAVHFLALDRDFNEAESISNLLFLPCSVFLFCFCLLSSSTGHLKRRHFCLGPPEDCCKVLFENLVTKAKPALLTVDCRVLHADCLRAQVKKLNRRVIQPMPPSRSFLCSRKSGLSSVPHVDDSMISRTVSVIDIEEKKWNLTCSQ